MQDWIAPLRIPLSGEVARDVPAFLRHHGLPWVAEHVARVAVEARRIAQMVGVDPAQAEVAGWLHDISAPIANSRRVESARAMGLAVLAEEEQVPMLLHQKQSVVIARELFGVVDQAVLDAIGCHTTLRRNASRLDKVLFVADKLAWDQGGDPPYEDAVTAALGRGLDAAVQALMGWIWQERAQLKIVHPWLKEAFLDATGSAWDLAASHSR